MLSEIIKAKKQLLKKRTGIIYHKNHKLKYLYKDY